MHNSRPSLATNSIPLLLALLLVAVACTEPAVKPSTAQQQAQAAAQSAAAKRTYYQPKNDIEGKNYEARLQIADDPTTILFCTVFPSQPGIKPITVPIQGKLTSGGKRPYPTTQQYYSYQSTGTYYPELPGPDGMYGQSGEYRYGFSPAGTYWDITNMESLCTTEPYVWQTRDTVIVTQTDSVLSAATARAKVAAAKGDAAGKVEAQRILAEAITSLGGDR